MPGYRGKLRAGMAVRAIIRSELSAGMVIGPGAGLERQAPLVIPDTAPLVTGRRAIVYVAVPGEKGMFVVNYRMQSIYFYTNKATHNIEYPSIVHSVAVGDVIKINVEKQEPLKLELKSFVESVQKGEKPLVSGEDGLLALETALKLIESAKKKKSIEFK